MPDPRPTTSRPATSAWTGGQYSVLRVLLAIAALVGLVGVPFPSELGSPVLRVLAGLAAVLLGLGVRDRTAAAVLLVLDGLRLAQGGEARPIELALAAALLLHLGSERAPYGAWSMRGRVDPGGGWRHAPGLLDAARLVASVACAATGFLQVSDPGVRSGAHLPAWAPGPLTVLLGGLGLLAPLLLALRPLRAASWVLLVVAQLLLLGLGDPGHSAGAVLLLLAFAFDPAWLAARPGPGAEPELVFYDGECGLCHRTVRFALAEDPAGTCFRFAPLQGPTFAESVTAAERARLPDSVLVRTREGRLLERSSAIARMLSSLGGLWRVAGALLTLVPGPLRDLGYDAVARVRKRLFAEPKGLCPVLPAELGGRFLP